MKISIGDRIEEYRKITDDDVIRFAKLTLDYNPIHFDEDIARGEGFPNRIVHGMLVGSLFSKIIGTELPGDGSIYVSQHLDFVLPVMHNETLKLVVCVKQYLGKKRFLLETTCYNEQSKVVVKGEAVVLVKKYEE